MAKLPFIFWSPPWIQYCVASDDRIISIATVHPISWIELNAGTPDGGRGGHGPPCNFLPWLKRKKEKKETIYYCCHHRLMDLPSSLWFLRYNEIDKFQKVEWINNEYVQTLKEDFFIPLYQIFLIKFIYSEKATKFCDIFPLPYVL